MVVSGAIATLDAVEQRPELVQKLNEISRYFRDRMIRLGFDILPSEHTIILVMLYDAKLAQRFAEEMLEEGVYVVAFSYPVVPKDKARIRTQMSAAFSRADIDRTLSAFAVVKKRLGL